MNKEIFFKILAEVLEVDQIDENSILDEYSWDSLAVLTLIGQVDTTFGVVLNPELVNQAKIAGDLLNVLEQSSSGQE